MTVKCRTITRPRRDNIFYSRHVYSEIHTEYAVDFVKVLLVKTVQHVLLCFGILCVHKNCVGTVLTAVRDLADPKDTTPVSHPQLQTITAEAPSGVPRLGEQHHTRIPNINRDAAGRTPGACARGRVSSHFRDL
ncbi:hypothetical protein TRVL_09281 [Trypanosoma vivax]|nr:hypothetical protein TRVL_09281 [Trypanosoma vivax]